MLAIMSWLLAAAPAGPSCADARRHYEALELERAVEVADLVLARGGAALDCLATRALALMTLGQLDEAKRSLSALFRESPDHPVHDPALSPAMIELIDAARSEHLPLRAAVSVRWLVHEALRLDVRLEGGLRGARRIRFAWRADAGGAGAPEPVFDAPRELELVGRVATATVAVPSELAVAGVTIRGTVLDARGEALHELHASLSPGPRPAALLGRPAPPPEDEGPSAVTWVLLTSGILLAVGGAVALSLTLAPAPPGTDGTLGRLELP